MQLPVIRRFFVGLLCLLVLASAKTDEPDQTGKIIVVIDPGHGGNDPGNLHHQANMMDEKAINLIISKKLGEYIEAYTKNVEVVYTRTTDKFVSLNDRAGLANRRGAHYFISIHCNSNPNRNVIGTESHIHNNNTSTSRQLAQRIEKDFKTRSKRKSRGVKTKADRTHNLQLLWQTNMPSVLTECGFMSNATEETYLNSTKGQELIASSIFRAFRDLVNLKHPFTILPKEDIPTPTEEAPEPVLAAGVSVYKVQVIATKTPLPADAIERSRLKDYTVEETMATDGRAYKYRYFVGRETDKKKARSLMKDVREAGIKDAFIVEFKN